MHCFITFSWEIDLLTSTSCATGSFTRMAFFFLYLSAEFYSVFFFHISFLFISLFFRAQLLIF